MKEMIVLKKTNIKYIPDWLGEMILQDSPNSYNLSNLYK